MSSPAGLEDSQGPDGLSAARDLAARQPNDAAAQLRLGDALRAAGRVDEAEAAYRRALAAEPRMAEAHLKLADLMRDLRKFEAAAAGYRAALALSPDLPEAHCHLAEVLAADDWLDAAAASYGRALAARPDYFEAQLGLAKTLQRQNRLDEAADAYGRAIELDPAPYEAAGRLGELEALRWRYPEAAAAYRRALQARPDCVVCTVNLGEALLQLGQFDEAETLFRKGMTLRPDLSTVHSSYLFARQHRADLTHRQRLEDARAFGRLARERAGEPYTAWQCDPEPSRLKVGIVSGDLCDHVVGQFLIGFLRNYSPDRLELYAYSNNVRDTPLTDEMRGRFAAWRVIRGVEDREAARLIHDDGVHVLLDLSGHTGRNRLPMFAWKPAPVQASWIGYFATTGVGAMDYFIADPHLIHPEDADQYVEGLWPVGGAGCLSPPDYDIEPNAPPFLTEGVFTFGCFNNLRKVTDEVVGLWARILRQAPDSRLFLKAPQLGTVSAQEDVLRRFALHGVGADRLMMEGMSPRDEYLRTYHRVDAALDPFPYTGATTSLEGVWMGVPVIVRAGDRLLTRVGELVANYAGLPDWIAQSHDAYVAKAVALAADPTPLAALRAELRQRALTSLMCDGASAARAMEDALWAMWRGWRDGREPSRSGGSAT